MRKFPVLLMLTKIIFWANPNHIYPQLTILLLGFKIA